MSRYTLYTYDDTNEFNQFYDELEDEGKSIQNFFYNNTRNFLSGEDDVIDISSMVKQVKTNQNDIYAAIYNLKDLCDDYGIIIKSELAYQAMEYFSIIFDNIKPIYKKSTSPEVRADLTPLKRKVLYTYENNLQLEAILDFADKNDIPLTDFSKFNGTENNKLKKICNDENKVLLDITNIVKASNSNPAVKYIFELSLDSLPFFDPIIREDTSDEALESYPLLFSSKKPVTELIEGIIFTSDEISEEGKKVDTVINLESTQLIYESLSTKLFGHGNFKKRFEDGLEGFLKLNEIGEEKIFSIFLLGNSGLGKTEVARIIKGILNDKTSLVKINFGNYSSDNALNSLMGSPRGYIGSEDGELSLKINKSKAGIILCDEFEKATLPVYNFFLELLEDGVFTDSQSREYDLNGYIIIFTSNIVNEKDYYEEIPKELQSRFDLVCDFKPLSYEEKVKYVNFQKKEFIDKLKLHNYPVEVSSDDENYFKEIIRYNENLRDIKRLIKRRILNNIK